MYDLSKTTDIEQLIEDGFLDPMYKSTILLANKTIKNIFNFDLKLTRLIMYKNETEFKEKFGQFPAGEGFYDLQNLTAHVIFYDDIFMIQRLFHEYYGHGIFCEYSKYGRSLRNYQLLLYILKLNGSQQPTDDEIGNKFPELNTFGFDYEGISDNRLADLCDSEGVAIWVERLLTIKTINRNSWLIRESIYKSSSIPIQHQKGYSKFVTPGIEMKVYDFINNMKFDVHLITQLFNLFKKT